MAHTAVPKIRAAAPRTRGEIIARPQAQVRPAREGSIAAPLTLAAIVVSAPLVAAAVALAGALGA